MENIDTLINRSEVITDHLNKIVHDGAHVIALPDGFSLASLEQYEAQRYYPRGYYSTRDYRDLLAYAAAREADFTGAAMYIDPEDMVARIIFDYDGGRGHGKNTANYNAEATPLHYALRRTCGRDAVSQKELIQLLEDWAGDITAHDKDQPHRRKSQAHQTNPGRLGTRAHRGRTGGAESRGTNGDGVAHQRRTLYRHRNKNHRARPTLIGSRRR